MGPRRDLGKGSKELEPKMAAAVEAYEWVSGHALGTPWEIGRSASESSVDLSGPHEGYKGWDYSVAWVLRCR